MLQGRKKNYQLFDKVVEIAEATGERVAVTDVERIPYTNAAWKSTGTDIADQLRKIKELQNEGVITEAEFETMKKELLTRMRGQTDPSK